MPLKVVLCGAGFLGSATHIILFIRKQVLTSATGSNIARAVAASSFSSGPERLQVQISSRHPEKLHALLKNTIPEDRLLPPISLDITNPSTLVHAFRDADVVVSLVGIMHGTPKDFEEIQLKGAENVANTAKQVGAKLIHFSAIGADASSDIPYAKTKGLAEISIRRIYPAATIVRPSVVFGPDDDFFNKFYKLSKFLPFLPVFGGGESRFQPVYVGDLARAVEVLSRNDPEISKLVSGKCMEAGGPDIFTFREMMQLVLRYGHRSRPVISVPFAAGMIQGAILERLPLNLFTVTRAQVAQLKLDNIVDPRPFSDHISFSDFLERYSGPLSSVHNILPTYL